MTNFPIAPKRPHQLTQHGITRIDDYYWLRNREDPEVLKYLQAENDYREEVMQHTLSLQETLFSEMKGRIKETDSTVPEKRGGYFYYTRMEEGKQYPIFCRKKESLENPEEILLDQNILAEGKPFCSVSAFSPSPDGSKLAYSLDVEGREVYIIYIKDLISGALYPEAIPNAFGSVYAHTGVEWANDNRTIFYCTLDDAQRSYRFMRHRLGTDPAQDDLVFQEDDEMFSIYPFKTRDNAYIMTQHYSTLTREVRYISADQPDGELKTITPRAEGVEFFAAHHKGFFYIITNKEARNFKLMKVPVANSTMENWQEVLPHREDVLIDSLDTFENYLVLHERKNGLKQICISDIDDINNARYVEFPEPSYDVEMQENHEFNTNLLRIKYSSLVTPNSIVDFHMDSDEWELKKRDEIPSGYDPSQYVCERIHATADDGTKVPISIVYKRDLKRDGQNPTLLYGYGAYGAVIDAEFNSSRFSLLDRGFVFAIGHIRGGSDMGRAWYEDGKMFNKKSSFTDFIACAEHLIKEGFTSKDKLAIYGVSAGGLLVSACATLRPDLFKAVIARVPFTDVVTSMGDPSIPLTTLEYNEWGNPDNKEYFDYMLSYSPYDNIRATNYPNMMITTGFNDPRVAYWEPAKFTAKLREMKTDDSLIILRTNFVAGHAGASGRYDFMKEMAQEFAFLIDRLGAR